MQPKTNVIEHEFRQNIQGCLQDAVNMAESLISHGASPLREVGVEKGYAHFNELFHISGDEGGLGIDAFSKAETQGRWHTHNTKEVIVVYQGSAIFQEEGQPLLILDKHSPFGIFESGSKHRPYFPEDCRAIVLLVPSDPELAIGD